MQAESMAARASSKPVVENARQIFRWNPNSVIGDGNPDPAIAVGHAHRHPFVDALRLLAGVLGVAHEVDKDLEDFVLFNVHGWHIIELANDLHSVPAHR